MAEGQMTVLEAALDYARRGWPVFPCHWPTPQGCSCGNRECDSPGKHPLTEAGFYDATTDELLIKAWWKKWPSANVAIATGQVSGLVVIDIDSREAADNFKARFPEIDFKSVPIVQTGRGWHLYFKYPGEPVQSRNGIMPGIDVKADGGYAIAPPSRHSGGKAYR